MTVISKASAFPKSVQPGIPALGPKPRGWHRGPLSDHLFEQQQPVHMRDDAEYRLVTVKRSRGGVVARETLKGREISVKSQFLLHPGDFLISKRQIVHGACGIVPPELEGSIASGEYAILRSKPTVDLTFFNYLAHSIYFQQTCFHSSIGVHVEKMIFKLDRWLSWDFDLPPICEQRKIAEILSTWDRAIAAQERLIANARMQRKALMQALLTGKNRLPRFKGEWKTKRLCDCILKIGSGITPRGGEASYKPSGIPLIRSQNVGWGRLLLDNVSFIDPEQHDLMSSTKLQSGDVLLNITGASIGRAAVYSGEHGAANVNQHVCIIRTKDFLDPGFLLAFLLSEFGQKQIDQFQAGGNRQGLNFEQVGSFRLPLPSLEEQRLIAEIFSIEEDQIAALQIASEKLTREKSALMQQLLTGKRRVSVRDSAALPENLRPVHAKD